MAGMYNTPSPSTVEKHSPNPETSAAYAESFAKANGELSRQVQTHSERVEIAKQNRVYLAIGPIVGGVLLANLLTALIVSALFALLR